MKLSSKRSIIILYILFALAIPVAVLGSIYSVLQLMLSTSPEHLRIEPVIWTVSLVIFGTYFFTYIYSLHKTRKDKMLTLKSFFPAFHFLIAFVFVLLLSYPISNYINMSYEWFGFAKKDFSVEYECDTHGGFLGDGDYVLILDCSENKEKAAELIKDWSKLPLPEAIGIKMYGGEKNGTHYGNMLSEKIPKIDNGYYMFEDRTPEYDENDAAHYTNFSIGLYDSDTDKMYYFRYDS